jgi:hypothetical protein
MKDNPSSRLLHALRETLEAQGIDLDQLCAAPKTGAGAPRVVVVRADLRQTAEQLASTPRDQVVMVRVDEETSRALDAWVETGSLKSRSEAAALFIKEGLRVHATEFRQLRDAIHDVDAARQRLREKAREVFGPSASEDVIAPELTARKASSRRRRPASKDKR